MWGQGNASYVVKGKAEGKWDFWHQANGQTGRQSRRALTKRSHTHTHSHRHRYRVIQRYIDGRTTDKGHWTLDVGRRSAPKLKMYKQIEQTSSYAGV